MYFFCNDTATIECYTYLHTLALHDALPIFSGMIAARGRNETETHPIRTVAVEILHPDDDVIEADDRFAHGVLPLRFSAAAFQIKAYQVLGLGCVPFGSALQPADLPAVGIDQKIGRAHV